MTLTQRERTNIPDIPSKHFMNGRGDCEDTSILMAALLKESGYEVGFLHLPGHLAVVLRTADDYTGGAITKSTDIAICILKARQADGISAISQRTS